jgi:hypothetical protein
MSSRLGQGILHQSKDILGGCGDHGSISRLQFSASDVGGLAHCVFQSDYRGLCASKYGQSRPFDKPHAGLQRMKRESRVQKQGTGFTLRNEVVLEVSAV